MTNRIERDAVRKVLTKPQARAVADAATPRQAYGFGAGRIDADPRTIKVLIGLGVAHETRLTFRSQAHLTRLGWDVAGKDPVQFAVLEQETP